jgi:hypothetical protein
MATVRKQRQGQFASSPPAPVVNIADRRSKREPLQAGRKPIIFLAVPSTTGKLNFTIAMLFGRVMASSALDECPFRFIVHTEVGKRGIDYARNSIVRTFLHDTDADWLYMIDDDQVVPDNFWQLCTVRDADVVSGLTPVWVGNMDAETMLRVNNYAVDSEHRCYNLPAPDESVKQPYRVPILGTGCIAIHRRVFAPKPHGVGDAPFYFTFMDDRKVRGGEDINFSVECNRAGFVLAVHPAVWFDHMKEMPLMQIERYYQARKAMEMAGKQPTEMQRLSIG